jgi:hypothetical protein
MVSPAQPTRTPSALGTKEELRMAVEEGRSVTGDDREPVARLPKAPKRWKQFCITLAGSLSTDRCDSNHTHLALALSSTSENVRHQRHGLRNVARDLPHARGSSSLQQALHEMANPMRHDISLWSANPRQNSFQGESSCSGRTQISHHASSTFPIDVGTGLVVRGTATVRK